MTKLTFTAEQIASMGKAELRQACRDLGVSYGKLNNDGIRKLITLTLEQRTAAEIAVHDLSDLDPETAYGATQCNDGIHDGDVLKLTDGAVAVLMGAWPTLVVGECEGFHKMQEGFSIDHIEGGKYARAAAKAREVAEEYVPTEVTGPFAQLLGGKPAPVVNSDAATRVENGKRVEGRGANRSKKEDAPVIPRASRKGYNIQKDREERVVDGKVLRRPSEGTVCGQVWAEFDANPEIKAADLADLADSKGWNRTNVSCEFYAWRKFMGIKGRSTK